MFETRGGGEGGLLYENVGDARRLGNKSRILVSLGVLMTKSPHF